MVHLIVGYGEVGKGLKEVLEEDKNNEIIVHDPDKGLVAIFSMGTFDVIHVCIPPVKDFEKIVKEWKIYAPLVIVHSSVAVGTCDRLGVVHSPIRGVHPHMAKGIKTFVKYFGGKQSKEAANIFSKLGLKVRVFNKAKTTEAIKLWDTTQYGLQIVLEKIVYRWCKENKIEFEAVYTQANEDYNNGYMELGRPEVVRPYLKHYPGLIGGHCVVPNAKILLDLDFDDLVREIEPNA